MTYTRHVALAVLAAGFLAQSAAAADADRGKKLYTTVGCYECHGTEGQGAAPTGPRLAPDPLPLPAFIQELRTPRNIMPPYAASVLADDAVGDIRAFLATIPQPKKGP